MFLYVTVIYTDQVYNFILVIRNFLEFFDNIFNIITSFAQ